MNTAERQKAKAKRKTQGSIVFALGLRLLAFSRIKKLVNDNAKNKYKRSYEVG